MKTELGIYWRRSYIQMAKLVVWGCMVGEGCSPKTTLITFLGSCFLLQGLGSAVCASAPTPEWTSTTIGLQLMGSSCLAASLCSGVS